MYVGRKGGMGDVALTVVALDSPAPPEVLERIAADEGILALRQVRL